MTPADLVDVLALEHELFPDDPWSAGMFAEEVAQPPESRLYLVAEADAGDGGVADGDIVSGRDGPRGHVMAGYAGMMFVPGGIQADVLTIAVHPAALGQRNRLRAARRDDRGRAGPWLRRGAPRGARRQFPGAGLYLRRGFEEIGVRRGYYKPSGVDAIVMRKDLLR